MRLVNVNYLKEGEILARPVINASGQILLQKGIFLTGTYIKRLKDYGFTLVFIEDDKLDDVEIHTFISAHTRQTAYNALNRVSYYLNMHETSPSFEQIKSSVQYMIEDILTSYDILGNLTEIHGFDEYTFHHSVNTTILALILGVSSGYSEQKLLELGMGVMMHDVGKIKIADQILNKKERLSFDEFEEIKRHTTYGFEILRYCRDLSTLSAHVALQHQEKWDGSGYPRGLRKNEIHEYGRITAIADVYEALTSKRVYRNAMEPYLAYEYIVANSGTHFEPSLVNIFCESIAIYPTGTGVCLSNGQRGNVIKQNPTFPDRPIVRMLYEDEKPLYHPIEYDLSQNPSLLIVKIENK